jgi:trans-aconitate methyltransferase
LSDTRDWEAEYKAGRLGFMDAPAEQLRHAVMGSLIASYAPGEVIDLGSGPGYLLRFLSPETTTRYIAVDASATALAAIPKSSIPVESFAGAIEAYRAPRRDLGAIVSAEAIYFLADPGAELKRLAEEARSCRAVIITLVVGSDKKPNWQRSRGKALASLARTGWTIIDTVRVASQATGKAWDVVIYKP